jgi:hypothetical protein
MTLTTDLRVPWLLLVFSLPAKSASQRVEVWRKLKRFGVLPLRSSGYVLPNSAMNQERMEWLAAAIRSYKGQASVVQVQGFDDLPAKRLEQLFLEARAPDYQKILHELKRVVSLTAARRQPGQLNRIRRRFLEVVEIDFFESPLRARIDKLFAETDDAAARAGRSYKQKGREYLNRIWMTRPRPGIDRVSSAWMIRRFIDPKARFVFGDDPNMHPDAIPFDMFCQQGFGHRGEDCTFETLSKQFAIRDRRVKRIAQIIHDADLADDKFGCTEGQGLDRVLTGWAKQDLPDGELLQRGMDLIEGLYEAMT